MVSNNTDLFLVHQNIRSLRANFDLFVNHLYLSYKNCLPKIIVLSEIWIYENELSFYCIDNYRMYAKCNQSSRPGGVMVFVSNDLTSKINEIDILSASGLIIKIYSDKVNFSLLALYRFHDFSENLFINELNYILDDFKPTEPIIIVGDMNINLLSDKEFVDKYNFLLLSYGFKSFINSITRPISKTCIDHIYIKTNNFKEINFSVVVEEIGLTDHSLLALYSDVFRNCPSPQENRCEINKKIDFKRLKGYLQTYNWEHIYQTNDVNDAFFMFIRDLKNIIEDCSYSHLTNKKMIRLKPWITNNLVLRINKRIELYKKNKKQPYNDKLKKYYNRYRNRLNNDIKFAKEMYYQNLFKNNSKVKEQWKIIDELIGERKNNSNRIFKVLKDNGEESVSDIETAEIFNKFFLEVANKLKQKHSKNTGFTSEELSKLDHRNKFRIRYVRNSLFLLPTSKSEVHKTIISLSNKKSVDLHGISNNVLKAVSEEISEVLSFLINLSFETGIFPNTLKHSIVVPIFKKGDPNVVTNYRPISLLSPIAKVVEKIMKFRLQNFLESNNILSKNQFGFRSGISTEDALLRVVSFINDCKNKNFSTSGLFIDLQKAFDMVDHCILMGKMDSMGIRGIPYEWFRSYLDNRIQMVGCNGSRSTPGVITSGVPQGSVLGPMLFLIYINDLSDGAFNGSITCFADDTALCYKATNRHLVHQMIEKDLISLRWWLLTNKIYLNIEKTKFIDFNLKQSEVKIDSLKYHSLKCTSFDVCNCESIKKVDNIKYLGSVLDSYITWKEHCGNLKKQLGNCLRKFYFLRSLCPTKVLKMLYYALIQSRLSYGIICWGGAYGNAIDRLNILQKHILRIMCKKSKYTSSWPLFFENRILPVRHLYIFKVLDKFYLRKGMLQNLTDYSARESRHKGKIKLPFPNYEYYKRTYEYMAPKLYNLLPETLINEKSYAVRKKYVINKLFEFDNVNKFFDSLDQLPKL